MVPLSPIVEFIALGAIAGYFTGYLIKKLLHLAFIIGVFVFLFFYMAHTDAVDLNFEQIGATIKGYADLLLNRLEFATFVSSSPFAGSFVVGFVFALMRS